MQSEAYSTINFMKDILSGKKKFFRRNEIKPVLVPMNPALSVKRVIEMVKKSKLIMNYLPNANELCHERISREYLFTIINTLDPDFFPGAIAELEERIAKKVIKN